MLHRDHDALGRHDERDVGPLAQVDPIETARALHRSFAHEVRQRTIPRVVSVGVLQKRVDGFVRDSALLSTHCGVHAQRGLLRSIGKHWDRVASGLVAKREIEPSRRRLPDDGAHGHHLAQMPMDVCVGAQAHVPQGVDRALRGEIPSLESAAS